jgi:PAS domain S-box-containing protein
MNEADQQPTRPFFLVGGGALGELIEAFDWSKTPIGPLADWGPGLRNTVGLILHSQVPIVTLWGEAGVMIYNDAYSVFAGGRHPALLGSNVREGWPEVADFNDNIMKTVLGRGETLAYRDQQLTLHRSGPPEPVWMDLDYSPIIGRDGKPSAVIGIVVETSDKIRALRHIENERQRLGEMFEQAEGFRAILHGPDHRIVMANPAYFRLIGHRDVLGRTVAEALPDAVEQGFLALLDQVFASGVAFSAKGYKLGVQAEPGGPVNERYVDFVYQPLTGEDGKVSGVFIDGVDVTDRNTTEELLRIAQEGGGVGAFEWFPDENRVEASEQYRRIWGLPPNVSVTAQMLVDLVLPEDRGLTGPARKEAANPLEYQEYRIRRPDTGEIRWVARQGEVIRAHPAAPLRYVGVAFDVTERKRADEALREAADGLRELNASLEQRVAERTASLKASEARLRSIFETSYQLQGLTTVDGILLDANSTSLEAIRATREQVVGRPFWETPWFTATPGMPEMVKAAVAAVAGGQTIRQEIAINVPGGLRNYDFSMRPIKDDAGRVVAIVPEAVDVTERRRSEEALRQAQKMEAVGQLTGGIAHDFNNMLAVVLGSLELLERRLGAEDTRAKRYVDAATEGARRAATLTQRLLAFSRQQPLRPEVIDPNRLVAGMSELLGHSLGGAIRLETVERPGVWRIRADPNQLENAIVNLAVNARDAMPDGGRLTIETGNVDADAVYVASNPGMAQGQYVLIAVTDTGAGMSAEVIAKAFDPFFTTKEVGRGTGLGLSQVYGFVRQSGGHVSIYSEQGQGTSVKICLPRDQAGEDEAAADPAAPPAARGDFSELVLVVEDEPAVRRLSVDALGELGYRVLAADGAAEALRLLDAEPDIALLFTDVVMPEMNGNRLAEEARRRRPGLKVLFTTGYTRDAVVNNGVLDPGVALVSKPFTMDELATKVRSILDS